MGMLGECSHRPRPWRPFWRRNVGSHKYWNFFYRSMYGNAGGMELSTPDLGDELGDEMWDLKNAGIFSISLLGVEIRIYPDDSM
ncbi:hypothetical protein AVEN_165581-1 [Araneus ventricosus]|uniref:Uncharacterized protein n=1 Tax=Araneus ventricosus TaxID=182803 RepID=A0A4Y2EPT6_ARAVE|nr:hypothetical protein AVEN_165581-1 [Araneus ventricosus]